MLLLIRCSAQTVSSATATSSHVERQVDPRLQATSGSSQAKRNQLEVKEEPDLPIHPTGPPPLSADGAAIRHILAKQSGCKISPKSLEESETHDGDEKITNQTGSFISGPAHYANKQSSTSMRAIEHKIGDKAFNAGQSGVTGALSTSVNDRKHGSWSAYAKPGADDAKDRRLQDENNTNKESGAKADGRDLQTRFAAHDQAQPVAGAPCFDPSTISTKKSRSAPRPDTIEITEVADQGKQITLDELISNARAIVASPVELSGHHPRRDVAPPVMVDAIAVRSQENDFNQPRVGIQLPPFLLGPVKKDQSSWTSVRDAGQVKATEVHPQAQRSAFVKSTASGATHERTATGNVGIDVSNADVGVAMRSYGLDQHKTHAPPCVKSRPDFGVKSNAQKRTSISMSRKQEKKQRRGPKCKERRHREEMAAKLEIEAGILKVDTRSTKRPGADSEGNSGLVKKARIKTEPTADESLNQRLTQLEPAFHSDKNTAIDHVEKCKAYERVIARLNTENRQAQLRAKSWGSLSENPNDKAEVERFCDDMIIGSNLAMRNLEAYPATLSRLRTLPHGQVKAEFTDYQRNGTSIDR